MRLALLTVVLAAAMGAAWAQPTAPVAPASAPAQTQAAALVAGQPSVKFQASYKPAPVAGLAPATTEADPDSAWHDYGMLLATLALMGVIAVRRQGRGRH